MPSLTHEALVELFRRCPDLGPKLWNALAGGSWPDGFPVELSSAEIADIQPAEYRADAVVCMRGASGRNQAAMVCEVQRAIDPEKMFSWPLYLAGVRSRLRCAVALLVVTLDESVAAWARAPIDLGFGQSSVRPVVIGPGEFPFITDPAQASAWPELAVLSVAAHAPRAAREALLPVARTALDIASHLDEARSSLYLDLILAVLSEYARPILEALIMPAGYTYKSEFARKYYQEGQEASLRKVLLRILAQRFGDVPATAAQRITAAELTDLERWADRVLVGDSIDAVLAPSS
jgi:hypothetical protein